MSYEQFFDVFPSSYHQRPAARPWSLSPAVPLWSATKTGVHRHPPWDWDPWWTPANGNRGRLEKAGPQFITQKNCQKMVKCCSIVKGTTNLAVPNVLDMEPPPIDNASSSQEDHFPRQDLTLPGSVNGLTGNLRWKWWNQDVYLWGLLWHLWHLWHLWRRPARHCRERLVTASHRLPLPSQTVSFLNPCSNSRCCVSCTAEFLELKRLYTSPERGLAKETELANIITNKGDSWMRKTTWNQTKMKSWAHANHSSNSPPRPQK